MKRSFYVDLLIGLLAVLVETAVDHSDAQTVNGWKLIHKSYPADSAWSDLESDTAEEGKMAQAFGRIGARSQSMVWEKKFDTTYTVFDSFVYYEWVQYGAPILYQEDGVFVTFQLEHGDTLYTLRTSYLRLLSDMQFWSGIRLDKYNPNPPAQLDGLRLTIVTDAETTLVYLDNFFTDILRSPDTRVTIDHFGDNTATDVNDRPTKPFMFRLSQNYPDPFNPSTTISYQLPKQSKVTLKLFDVLGREVATLVNSEQGAGYKSVSWNGEKVPSGIYFYRMTAGAFTETKKLLLLK